MLKRFLFAVAPMVLFAGSVMADDSLLSSIAKMDLSGAAGNSAQVEEADQLGQADVEALLGEDDEQSTEEAVAACFRRIGYGYGYRSYGYRSYGCRSYYGYRSWCSPVYRSYYSYPARHCYRPVSYSYYTPIYTNYWGCW